MSELAAPSMTIEGSLNTVRVPNEVFLNGSHHSYTVASASFRHVQATSVSILENLDSITVDWPYLITQFCLPHKTTKTVSFFCRPGAEKGVKKERCR